MGPQNSILRSSVASLSARAVAAESAEDGEESGVCLRYGVRFLSQRLLELAT